MLNGTNVPAGAVGEDLNWLIPHTIHTHLYHCCKSEI
jgi:hypothetical protein